MKLSSDIQLRANVLSLTTNRYRQWQKALTVHYSVPLQLYHEYCMIVLYVQRTPWFVKKWEIWVPN